MYRLLKLILVIYFFSSTLLFGGCSKNTNYSNSSTTWGDVNREFIKLEQQRENTLDVLRNKTSISNPH